MCVGRMKNPASVGAGNTHRACTALVAGTRWQFPSAHHPRRQAEKVRDLFLTPVWLYCELWNQFELAREVLPLLTRLASSLSHSIARGDVQKGVAPELL